MDNPTHIVKITGYGSKGEGVARLGDGRVVFVRGAARDDVCEIATVSERARSCRGEIIKITQPSPHRIEPDCPVYPVCGGCDFRHITYEEELKAKLERVNDALSRIGGVSLQAGEIITAGRVDGYRNKAVFHIARLDGKIDVGFYRAESHEVCPIEHCLLLREELNDALKRLLSAPIPNEKTITLRVGTGSEIVEEMDGLVLGVSQTSFFQVNSEVAILLYKKAREYAALDSCSILVDLYSGVGSLTLFLGRDAGYALGVESNPAAVEDAVKNALRNRLNHVDFVCSDVAKWDAGGIRPDCVVIDPPRRGLSAEAVRKILKLSPSRVVYVSCDPATLSRDIKQLGGYKPISISVFDMFPRTANVECCLLFERI